MISTAEARKFLTDANKGNAVIDHVQANGATITFIQVGIATDAVKRAFEAGHKLRAAEAEADRADDDTVDAWNS